MYVINKHKKYLIYMFPKSGCSTLRIIHAYLSANRDEWDGDFFEDRHHGIQRRDDKTLFQKWGDYHDYTKVLVYRNPYERIVSLFFQKVCGVPAVTCRGKFYDEPIRLRFDMRTFENFVDVLVTCHFHHDEHFQPQRMPPCKFDRTLELSDVSTLFAGLRDDLHTEVQKILAYTKKSNWNHISKFAAPDGSYAAYDFYRDMEQWLAKGTLPSYNAMLTPEICRKIDLFYDDYFTSAPTPCIPSACL